MQFESRPGDPELGRLVDSTLWINDAHPAYARAAASRSTGYHLALSVALALAPLAIGAEGEHAFITQFLAHWGDASGGETAPSSSPAVTNTSGLTPSEEREWTDATWSYVADVAGPPSFTSCTRPFVNRIRNSMKWRAPSRSSLV